MFGHARGRRRVLIPGTWVGPGSWVLPGWGMAGWVQGRVLPVHQPAARGGSRRQRSGPRRPCRGRSGWSSGAGRPVPPFGPGRSTLWPSLHLLEQVPHNAVQTASNRQNSVKVHTVSQNRRVSLKYVNKAYVSPCFQNGSQISPLDFLGFPFLVAFSHKELMVAF